MAARAFININDNKLVLSGILDYESVLEVDKQVQEWLKKPSPAQSVLDMSGVSYSSSAGIALLLGWLRVAKQQHKVLQIFHLPSDMLALAKVDGLEAIFIST